MYVGPGYGKCDLFFPFTKLLLSVTQKWSATVKKSCDVWAKQDKNVRPGFLPTKSC